MFGIHDQIVLFLRLTFSSYDRFNDSYNN